MKKSTKIYLEKLLEELSFELRKTAEEQGTREGKALPNLVQDIRRLRPPRRNNHEDALFRKAIFAPTGCGKTHVARACARALTKAELGMHSDADTAFVTELAKNPCMEGIFNAGMPVLINARAARRYVRHCKTFMDLIEAATSAAGNPIPTRLINHRKLLFIIDGLEPSSPCPEQDRILDMLARHLQSTDDSLMLLCSIHSSSSYDDLCARIPSLDPLGISPLSEKMVDQSLFKRISDFLRSMLEQKEADLVIDELSEESRLSECIRNVQDLLVLSEVVRANRPIPRTRNELYEEYTEFVCSVLDRVDCHAPSRSTTLERLAVSCSLAETPSEASQIIEKSDLRYSMGNVFRVNEHDEWEFRFQSLQSYLTSRAIERGRAGDDSEKGIAALLLVKDKQIKEETLDFLSVKIRPDQQVLLLKELDCGNNDDRDMALSYLPKPESAECANILYKTRFGSGVYLSDAWLIFSSDPKRHREAIESFLERIEDPSDYEALTTCLEIRLTLEEDISFRRRRRQNDNDIQHAAMLFTTIAWLSGNGVLPYPGARYSLSLDKLERICETGVELLFGVDHLPNFRSAFSASVGSSALSSYLSV